MKTRLFNVALMCLLVALTGCSTDYTEGVEGTYFKTSNGQIFVLEQRIGDLHMPVKVDIKKLNEHLKNANDVAGN